MRACEREWEVGMCARAPEQRQASAAVVSCLMRSDGCMRACEQECRRAYDIQPYSKHTTKSLDPAHLKEGCPCASVHCAAGLLHGGYVLANPVNIAKLDGRDACPSVGCACACVRARACVWRPSVVA